jgi:hypothetical protein
MSRTVSFLMALAISLFALPALAQLKPLAAAQNGDLGVTALLTTDQNWEQTWFATPEGGEPEFEAVDRLHDGDKATLLVFYSGVEVASPEDLTCALTVTRADFSVAAEQPSLPCALEGTTGPKDNTFLTSLVVTIDVNENEQAGPLTFDIEVTHVPSEATVELTVGAVIER